MLHFREVLQTAVILISKGGVHLGPQSCSSKQLLKGRKRQAFISLGFLIASVLVHSAGPKKGPVSFWFLLTMPNHKVQSPVSTEAGS